MSDKLLKNIILIGIFLIPFTSLIVAKSLFFPFITGKAFFFRTIVEVIFFLWLILAIREEEYRPKFSWISVAVFIFLIAVGLADLFSENVFKSFWSNFERMEGYITLLHFVAYFLVITSILKTREIWDKLMATSVFASTIMALYSFLQLVGKITINQGGVRVDGTFGNASYLGIYAVFHMFFAAIIFFRVEKKMHKWLLVVAFLMNIVVLYYTATRGAVLGFLGGALITLFYLVIKAPPEAKIKKFAIGIILFLIFSGGIFYSFRNTNFIKTNSVLSRFVSISFSEIKTQGRYYVWPMAWKGFIERPVFGWGQESFNFVFNKYYDPGLYKQEPWFDRTHNIILDWLIAAGILGFLSYAAIYFFSLRHLRFFQTNDKALILGLLAAYIFHNLFVFDQIGSYILFFTLLGFLHSNSPDSESALGSKTSAKVFSFFEKENYRPIAESFLVICLVLSFYFVIFVPWKQNKNILAVLRLSSENSVGVLDIYKAPLKNYVLGFSEALEHVSQLAINLSTDNKAPVELKQNVYKEVDYAFKKYIETQPNDARYRLFYGLFLSAFGNYEGAASEFKMATELSPKKQDLYLQLVNNLLVQNKIEEALAVAKNAYEISPDVEESKFIYGIINMLAGRDDLAKEILKEVSENKLVFDDRYLAILQQLNRYDEIISIVKRRIELNPDNQQYKMNMAAAYLIAGKREMAVEVIQQMIKEDPSFKERGEYYIKEIREGRNP